MPNSFQSTLLAGTAAIIANSMIALGANAADFNIPGGDLKSALDSYSRQTGVSLLYSDQAIKGAHSRGVQGEVGADEALSRILSGTGFQIRKHEGSAITIVRGDTQASETIANFQIAQAAPARAAVETVTVTSSKLGGADVQSIPIAITALSQEQLTASQTAGGPDLVKQVPNLTFTKTNFTGYSIQIRGIGTQAISVTTDPAVAVAMNDVPFIRNHFFEQEFYDLGQVEVLRGPQGTLYGRNATAGVVNLTTAKPTDQFEAMASGELGNYHQRRFEGMINLPIVDDRLDIRIAGEWTKRQGYSFNELTDQRIDGRDLWSGRVTIGWKPIENLQTYLVWEHFSENDDRMRTSKQLCHNDPGKPDIGNVAYTSQGCKMSSLYSSDAFQVPNGFSLPYYNILSALGAATLGTVDPYTSATQSRNLRIIESHLDPVYKVKNDIVELNSDFRVSPSITLSSQTAFNHDFLYSTEDYNRFNTAPAVFGYNPNNTNFISMPDGDYRCNDGTLSVGADNCGAIGTAGAGGFFCDPQLGCSDRLVAQDESVEHAWQLSQEFRAASNFSGPFNFSFGANFLHYETEENYYVFINSLTLFAASTGVGASFKLPPWNPGISDNHECMPRGLVYGDPNHITPPQFAACYYIDPNPLDNLNDNGHNYFLSENPYVLNSYAAFGEAYYKITDELKLTAGLRWTEDQKHFSRIPSWLLVSDSWGLPVLGVVDQQWDQFSGRVNATWTPKLNFTDQTLIYGSYAHGYKAGGANPPGALLLAGFEPIHPLTFKPEFVDAFELGSKNTLLDGALTINASAFYYNYENYQISEIVDRTSINLNFDAHVHGAEVETSWEPVPGLRLNFAGGYETTSLAHGSKAVDLMDRTAGNPDWVVIKPYPTAASNCVVPIYVAVAIDPVFICQSYQLNKHPGDTTASLWDPVTQLPYKPFPTESAGTVIPPGYPGFDPSTAPNGGAGFDKDLAGNELPNAPPLTVSAGAQYTIPLNSDWAATLRGDYYWQDYSWARVFNDSPYDRLRGYTNVNLTLIFTSQFGWQVMLYDKNLFNTTAITGTFLNSDDTGLTTNVFLTDPKLIGVRITKNW